MSDIKTEMIEVLAKEVYRWEPQNKELKRFLSMDVPEVDIIKKGISTIDREGRFRK